MKIPWELLDMSVSLIGDGWYHKCLYMSAYQVIHIKYVLFLVYQLYSKKTC